MKKILPALRIAVALMLILTMFTSCGFGSTESLKPDDSGVGNNIVSDESNVPSEPENSGSNELSDNYEDYEFMIFDEVYKLPMTFKEFVGRGWQAPGDVASEELEPNQTFFSSKYYRNNIGVYAGIINFDTCNHKVEDCYVYSIEYTMGDDNATDTYLPGGFKVGEANVSEIKAAYGSNCQENSYDNYSTAEFFSMNNGNRDYMRSVRLECSTDGTVNKVEVKNKIVPADFKASEGKSTPFFNYTAPTQLGTNLDTPVFTYDGKMYSLPCPLSELLNNGWVLDDDATADDAVSASSTETVYLTYKDDYRRYNESGEPKFDSYITAHVCNTTNEGNILKNCLVKEISFYCAYKDSIDEFGKRVVFGVPVTTKDEFTSYINQNNVKVETKSETDNGDTYDNYTYTNESLTFGTQDALYDYRIKVGYRNGKLVKIGFELPR